MEGVVQPLMSIVDATVYGVELPKREGRAGMISVVLAENADLNVGLLLFSDLGRDVGEDC